MKQKTNTRHIDEFSELLRTYRTARRERHESAKAVGRRRRSLSAAERKTMLAKTAGRCHICGGGIHGSWQADHVLAHSSGGGHIEDNYLPAHALCNNYRWDYSADEFQHMLKLGVWIRTQIERKTPVGVIAAEKYLSHDAARLKGRRS